MSLSPQNRRANDLVATISSLKVELEDTNKSLEVAYLTKKELVSENESLSVEKEELKKRITKDRNTADALVRKISELTIQSRELETSVKNRVQELETKKELLEEKIIQLGNLIIKAKDEQETIVANRLLEIENLEKQIVSKLETVKELKSTIEIGQLQLKKLSEDRAIEKKLLETIIKEKKETRFFIKKGKENLVSQLKNVDKLRDDWEIKHRDLRIIARRLEKMWGNQTPFPRLDWLK